MPDFITMHPLDVAALNTPEALDHFWGHDYSSDPNYYGSWDDPGARIQLFTAVARYAAPFFMSSPPSNTWSVCDVGCGPGHLLQALMWEYPDIFFSFVGIDFAKSAIDRAVQNMQNLPSTRLWGKAFFWEVDFLDNNLPTGLFDLVTCVETLEHIADYHKALDEMVRVTKPGGGLIITVPNIPAGTTDPCKAHVNQWDMSSLQALLMPYGLIDIHHIRRGTNLLARLRKE